MPKKGGSSPGCRCRAINVALVLHIAFDPTSGSVEGSIGMQRSVHNVRRKRPVKKLACRLTIASPLPALFATFTLQDQGQPAYRQDRILFKPSLTRITSFCATQEKGGSAPQKWLNDLRLQEAPRRLLQGHHVKEVAFELGFAHPSHFIREFRRVYYCTPFEFVYSERRQAQHRGFLLTAASPSPGLDPFGTPNKAGSFLPKTGSGNTRHLKKRFHLFSIECERQGALSGAHRGRLTSARSAMVRSQTSPSCN